MKPPYTLTEKILNLCTEITRILGRLEGLDALKPEPKLRKSNRLRTIQASLAIEGNSLSIDQMSLILDGKPMIGPRLEVLEVKNAIKAYSRMLNFKPFSVSSFKEAHHLLMAGLIADAGKWRKGNVGIYQGTRLTHAAPQAKRVPELMDQLFRFVKSEKQVHPLILSAIFHYELEFIHPFADGNGRLGRLWQTRLLINFHPLFELTPLETIVYNRQQDYYQALGLADKQGEATPFVEFSLETILTALSELLPYARMEPLSAADRLAKAKEQFLGAFSRKDYLNLFKTISTATASRDLAIGVKQKLLNKIGEKSRATYTFFKP